MRRVLRAAGFAAACLTASVAAAEDGSAPDYDAAYLRLRAKFSEATPGRGIDRGGPRDLVADQPMTCGLVLSAESVRLRSIPDEEGKRRVRLAVRWLLDNARPADDGRPGWGLPFAWDARPANTPYTITTAVAIEGLLDALAVPIWTPGESEEIRTLIRGGHARWNRDLRVAGHGGLYYGYSPRDMSPAWFCVNAPAMYLGAMARFLKEHGETLAGPERDSLRRDLDDLARAVVATVAIREGAPYWDYIAQPNPLGSRRPNDLVHQAYILWGVETYRDAGGAVPLPWSRAKAVESLDRFWKDGTPRFFAQDEPDVKPGNREAPANVWGVGMLLACCAKWGGPERTRRCHEAVLASYGPFPAVRVLPAHASDDDRFYPRDAAHVLFGLAHAAAAQRAKR